jgi:arylsulfatase A-like enzyme
MSRTIPADLAQDAPGLASKPARAQTWCAGNILLFSAWCGLAGGWLEVATRIVSHEIDPVGRLYQMSRHFVWLAPVGNLALFLALGLCLSVLIRFWPRLGSWIGPRLIGAFTLLPALWVAGPRIYRVAWFVLALGIAARLAPRLERFKGRLWPGLLGSFPVLLGLIPLVAGFVFGMDRLKLSRESSRPMPPAGSPSVLLIVLDTVRADRMSLHGYHRATTPMLERLAQRGIRFDEARATAPWTLPSHASMFTGRLPRELAVKWMTQIGSNFPTLAQYLGSRGYATAGFVANNLYCSYDTGLARGFTHYEDYTLDEITPLRTSLLADAAMNALFQLGSFVEPSPIDGRSKGRRRSWMEQLAGPVRKSAQALNQAFLDWLSARREPGRPFFVFLNYYDAHASYLPPGGTVHRFGSMPQSEADYLFLGPHWSLLDKMKVAPRYQTLARDSYDNCLAYLDEQLGALVEGLKRRGLLERTLLVVTSDHGEGFGEHGLFDHGESLYRTEIRVPLVIVLPGAGSAATLVRETVSLRDLPATIADLVGLKQSAPFPGQSLVRFWTDRSRAAASTLASESGVISELADPNPSNPNRGRSPAARGPLVALAEGNLVYIRNERDGSEQLFDVSDDPYELIDRAGLANMKPLLLRLRTRLNQFRRAAVRAPEKTVSAG